MRRPGPAAPVDDRRPAHGGERPAGRSTSCSGCSRAGISPRLGPERTRSLGRRHHRRPRLRPPRRRPSTRHPERAAEHRIPVEAVHRPRRRRVGGPGVGRHRVPRGRGMPRSRTPTVPASADRCGTTSARDRERTSGTARVACPGRQPSAAGGAGPSGASLGRRRRPADPSRSAVRRAALPSGPSQNPEMRRSVGRPGKRSFRFWAPRRAQLSR